jgi:sulfur-carrier protein adenylyltransferase/sulfurtransferase
MFAKKELSRYSRHIQLSEIGHSGQEKLKLSKVLVVGAGGLGCPALQYLTAAGVGVIGICDGDKVEESNLQRQVLYAMENIGEAKVSAAKSILQKQNPFVKFVLFDTFLNQNNALDIISQFDIVIDGSDNFETRYLINDTCLLANKPMIFASILKFEGQISVFNYQNGPTYRCLFPEPPNNAPSCSDAGVLGVLPGIMGTLQANEVVKIILGIGEVLSGKLLTFNALNMQFQFLEFDKNDESMRFVDYHKSDQIKCKNEHHPLIDINTYRSRLNGGEKFNLIDLRESYEKTENIEHSISIPFEFILDKFSTINQYLPTILFCVGGSRSKIAQMHLKEQYPNLEILSLIDGAKAFD